MHSFIVVSLTAICAVVALPIDSSTALQNTYTATEAVSIDTSIEAGPPRRGGGSSPKSSPPKASPPRNSTPKSAPPRTSSPKPSSPKPSTPRVSSPKVIVTSGGASRGSDKPSGGSGGGDSQWGNDFLSGLLNPGWGTPNFAGSFGSALGGSLLGLGEGILAGAANAASNAIASAAAAAAAAPASDASPYDPAYAGGAPTDAAPVYADPAYVDPATSTDPYAATSADPYAGNQAAQPVAYPQYDGTTSDPNYPVYDPTTSATA